MGLGDVRLQGKLVQKMLPLRPLASGSNSGPGLLEILSRLCRAFHLLCNLDNLSGPDNPHR